MEITETPDGRRHRHDQVLDLGRPGVGDAEHGGDRVAVDVGVDDADRAACGSHGQREVDRDRGLADPALAAGDREDLGQLPRLGERDLALGLAATQRLWSSARCSSASTPGSGPRR